jgi:hypothetical protein
MLSHDELLRRITKARRVQRWVVGLAIALVVVPLSAIVALQGQLAETFGASTSHVSGVLIVASGLLSLLLTMGVGPAVTRRYGATCSQCRLPLTGLPRQFLAVGAHCPRCGAKLWDQ